MGDLPDNTSRLEAEPPSWWGSLPDDTVLKTTFAPGEAGRALERIRERTDDAFVVRGSIGVGTLSIGVPARYKKQIQVREQPDGLTLLEDLADKTGGLHYTVEFSNEAGRVAKQVGLAIRNQYLIGYRPPDGEAGRWHKIRVKLDVPDTNVYARNGYYSR